jgi:Xaa-Pro aminopeptidase
MSTDSRIEAARERLTDTDADALWIHPSVELRYLSGLELLSLERPTGLLIPRDGPLRLLIPLMLLPQAAGLDAEPVAWSDEAGPEPALAKVLSGVRRLLVEPSLPMGAAVLLRSCAPGLELELDPGIVAELRERKDDAEIAALRAAGRLADEMAAWTATQPLDGLTELRLAGRMQARFLEQGHPPHPDFIVATGANGALPHHETGDAPIDPAAPLLLDFGCLVDGYFSDLTRVLFPPATAPEVEEAYAVVLAAHDAAVAAVAAGVPCEEVDRAARQVVEAAGQGERFLHRTGHGLGLEIHEPPYLRSGNPAPLEVGHVFSIEPGIYVPGAFGLRFETIYHLGEHGAEPLNHAPRRMAMAPGPR